MLKRFRSILYLLLCFLPAITGQAQGSGARSFLLSPKGVTGIDVRWIHLSQNLIPAGTALIPGADIRVDVFPVTLFHTFSLGGQFAQVYAMLNPGTATARAKAGPPIGPIPINELNASGLSDGFVALKVGILGAPALNLADYAKTDMQFSLFADVHLGYSGTYNQKSLLNLGTNRMNFQVGFPMSVPLNKNRQRATWLELAPSAQFFTANNDPARASAIQGVDKITQKPLYVLESHLTHNLNPKFWVGGGLRFQYGGETFVDGKPDDNNISAIAGGIGVGYQLLPPLNLKASYGTVLWSDETKGSMIRIGLTFSYAKRP